MIFSKLFQFFIVSAIFIKTITSKCGKGQYKEPNGACSTCPAGTFNNSDDSDSCQNCPPGTWTFFYGADNHISCSGCGKGKFINENKQCQSCPQGTYNDQVIGDSCKPCLAGTWNWFYSADNRVTCSGCGKGKFMVGNKICSDCAPGEYSTQENATYCIKVPPGQQYTNINSEPKACEKGLYSTGGRNACVACPNNTCETIQLNKQDIEKILKLADLAHYAYDIDLTESKHKLESMKLITNPSMETRALIGYDKSLDSIVITYRGTENLKNLVTDIKLFKDSLTGIKDCDGCKVHQGFKQGYDTLDTALELELKNLKELYPNSKIIITGHSYGAAIATLKAISLQSQGLEVSLITFGSPRVGNKEFSEYANKQISGSNYRITYQDDPVISLPPTTFGYNHLGSEVQFYNNKEYYIYPKNLERDNNLDSTDFNNHSEYWNLFKNVEEEKRGNSEKELIFLEY